MKTLLPKLLKGRLVRLGGLLAVIAAVFASIAWSRAPEARAKLGGTWVGRLGDITWTSTWSPDSSGQNATVTLQWMTMDVSFEALVASVGAQTLSRASGSVEMTSKHSAAGKLIWYLLAEGTPSVTDPVAGQIKAIAVMANEYHFTGPNTAVGTHHLQIYGAPTDGSMVPADEATPFLDQTFADVPHLRVF